MSSSSFDKGVTRGATRKAGGADRPGPPGQSTVEYLVLMCTVVLAGGLAIRAIGGALRGYYSLISFLLGLPIP